MTDPTLVTMSAVPISQDMIPTGVQRAHVWRDRIHFPANYGPSFKMQTGLIPAGLGSQMAVRRDSQSPNLVATQNQSAKRAKSLSRGARWIGLPGHPGPHSRRPGHSKRSDHSSNARDRSSVAGDCPGSQTGQPMNGLRTDESFSGIETGCWSAPRSPSSAARRHRLGHVLGCRRSRIGRRVPCDAPSSKQAVSRSSFA